MYKLEVQHVNVSLNGKMVLNDINVTIPEHTVTACIGPPRGGKSIFLRMFNRMNEIIDPAYGFTGEILIDHRNIYDLEVDVLRRRIGMIFQEPNPFQKSIADNVSFGLLVHGITHKKFIAEVVERSLRQVLLWDDVKDKLNASVTILTRGQQQLLCIARALAVEPTVLLLEESTSMLDPMSTYKIEELIYNLKKKLTILFSTNSVQQASRISDHTAFFYAGELIEFDETARIFTNPRSGKTENYITGRFN